jgi:NADPH:quinone reductase-like Zn-dependent oxidoreductase
VGAAVYSRVDSTRAGTFAESVAVAESLVALKPANIDFVAAASVPLAALAPRSRVDS